MGSFPEVFFLLLQFNLLPVRTLNGGGILCPELEFSTHIGGLLLTFRRFSVSCKLLDIRYELYKQHFEFYVCKFDVACSSFRILEQPTPFHLKFPVPCDWMIYSPCLDPRGTYHTVHWVLFVYSLRQGA